MSQEKQEIKDNSKPTNVYSQIDNFFEYENGPDYSTYGYNPKLTYAPNETISFVLETPLKYNTKTQDFGLADMRLRTFYVPYKNYDNTFGSFGASIDIYAPTGKYESGLGSSSWRVSPGLIFGLILNDKQTISIFPNVSYTYTSKPTSKSVPEKLNEVDHGWTLQVTNSFVLSEDAFVLITPIYNVKDVKDISEDEFIIEIETVFDIFKDKYQAGIFYKGTFESNIHTASLYFTLFL